jgi:hypothetical protein
MAKFVFSILTIFCVISAVLNEEKNTRLPVIGVLTVPLTEKTFKIEASYQRWLEASGADTLAIRSHWTEDQILADLKHVNGILLQDYFNVDLNSQYNVAVKVLLAAIRKSYTEGTDYIPIFAIGDGLQTIAALEAADPSIVQGLALEKTTTKVFKDGLLASTTRMYGSLSESELRDFEDETSSVHVHKNGLPLKYSRTPTFLKAYKVTSVGKATSGELFVNSFEHWELPIYAVQFRPDKIAFDRDSEFVNHGTAAVRASRALGNFFVNESRKNEHSCIIELKADAINPNKNLPKKDKDVTYYYEFENTE